MDSEIRIARKAIGVIAAHARAETPRECCGLLIGVPGVVTEAVPTDNVAADPSTRYEIPPADYFREVKRWRAEGLAVTGAYHSHPAGPPDPSPTDIAEAFGDFLFLIAGRMGSGIEVRAYRLQSGALQRVALVVA